tara:strand:+ start:421 stop:906 length:486 start_codon:yes stop_codon:yes gene_type:complete
MVTMPNKKRRQSTRQGAVAVEFAFIAPVFISIVMGLIQTTRIYDSQNLLETAAREGARFAAMDRSGMPGEGGYGNAKMTQDIKNFMASSGVDSDNVQVKILDHEDPSQTFDIDDPENDLKLFQVEVTVPFSSVSITSVSEGSDYGMSGKIIFRNGRATLSE